jgi:hypothetical protein
MLILVKAARLSPTNKDAKPGYAAPLGLVRGLLDAIGGERWGPLVTSTLIGSGQATRHDASSTRSTRRNSSSPSRSHRHSLSSWDLPISATSFIALIIGLVVAAPLGA